jgi:hypothetical protein
MTAASSTQVDSITVDSGRPLSEALRHFQARYGWIVTYEDPPYAYGQDVVDVTDAVRNPASKPSGHRVMVPRGGPFAVTFVRPSPASSPTDVLEIVRAIVDQFAVTGYPGEFRALSAGGVVHVVPVAVKAQDGGLLHTSSILDTRVSLPEEKNRSAFTAIRSVLTAVETATGQQVDIGTVPINLLVQSRMEESTKDLPARELLVRTLRATGKVLSWRLLYGPDVRRYAFNIHVVHNGKQIE